MTPALLDTLSRTSPLPDGWSALEVVEDVVVADGVELHRAGIASTCPSGEEVTGSAAQASPSPIPRSYYELLERAATLEAIAARHPRYELITQDAAPAGSCSGDALFPESDDPQRWRYARSNGVAIHADWRTAASRAFWELAERDRVLRSWYGAIRPQRLPWNTSTSAMAASCSYEWRAYAFLEPSPTRFASAIRVAGVFGFPKHADAPLVLGFGARPAECDALDAATSEAMQLLAFLWGEPVVRSAPELGPTPMHHLEYFQYAGHHDLLRSWLSGAHMTFRGYDEGFDASASHVAFVDLTPPWLVSGHRVAKAVCAGATPLAFGDAPFAAHHLPPELRAHPIA